MNQTQMRQCVCAGILLSLAAPGLTTMACDDDDSCPMTSEKELLQSSGHVRAKIAEADAEEGNSKIFFIYSKVDPTKCFDIPGNKAVNGKQLQVYDCNWSPAQQFTYNPSDSTIRPTKHSNMCLDGSIPEGEVAKVGYSAILWECWGGDTQKWDIKADTKSVGTTYIMPKNSGLCVGDKKKMYDKGNPLTLTECTEDQVQTLPGFFPGFSLHKSMTSMCIDIPSQDIKNGAKMQIWDCNDSPAQKWYYWKTDGSIRPTKNLDYCLDSGSKQQEGDPLLLWKCNEKDWQKWTLPAGVDSSLSLGFANLKLEKKDLCVADATKKYSKSASLTMQKCSEDYLLSAPGVLGIDINPLAATSTCLDISENKLVKGQMVIAWKCHANEGDLPSDNQNFFLNTQDHSIRSAAEPNLCFDVVENKVVEGQGVQVWTCNAGPNQQFEVEGNEIKVKGTDLCVADPKHEYADGAAMKLTQCTTPKSKNKIASFKIKGQEKMLATWMTPNKFKKPQCADGEVAWNCNEVGHGPRISCPKEWPYMCNNPNQCSGNTASKKKDRCCSESKEQCDGGLRPF